MSCVDFSARESRELTRIGKRRDWLLDFAKLWECDTSPCRFALEPSASRKAVRGRPPTPKAFHAKPCPSFAFIRVIRAQNLGCNVAQASRPQRRAYQTIIFCCGVFCFTGTLLPENLAAINFFRILQRFLATVADKSQRRMSERTIHHKASVTST